MAARWRWFKPFSCSMCQWPRIRGSLLSHLLQYDPNRKGHFSWSTFRSNLYLLVYSDRSAYPTNFMLVSLDWRSFLCSFRHYSVNLESRSSSGGFKDRTIRTISEVNSREGIVCIPFYHRTGPSMWRKLWRKVYRPLRPFSSLPFFLLIFP